MDDGTPEGEMSTAPNPIEAVPIDILLARPVGVISCGAAPVGL